MDISGLITLIISVDVSINLAVFGYILKLSKAVARIEQFLRDKFRFQ